MRLFIIPCCGFRMFGCFGVVLMALWLWVLIDCLRNEPRTGSIWVLWLIVILVGQIFGAALYLLIRRPERIALYGR